MPISAKLVGAPVSLKQSMELCSAISGKKVSSAKRFLNNLLLQKESLDGKYFSTATRTLLELLESGEANARQKNMAIEKLFVKMAKADKGQKFIRPRSRFKFRGKQAKITNLTITLEER